MLDKNKLYYLSHPYTSFGELKKNIISAKVIELSMLIHQDIKLVNPISIMPILDDEEAMEKCKHLYNACDAIILCENWQKSKGCMEEYRWALKDRKPIYILTKGSSNKYDYIVTEYKTA
jgi:hypothetical protein